MLSQELDNTMPAISTCGEDRPCNLVPTGSSQSKFYLFCPQIFWTMSAYSRN